MNLKEIETLKEPEKSLQYLRHPDLWTHWSMCPVKRTPQPDDPPACEGIGVVRASRGPVVYRVNMLMISTAADLQNVPRLVYPTFDALIADGWLVD